MIYAADRPDPRAPINPRTGQLEGEIPAVPQIPLFYITYGIGTDMRGKYSVVQAASEDAAREVVQRFIGKSYAFIYPSEDFDRTIAKWNLVQAPLTAAKPV